MKGIRNITIPKEVFDEHVSSYDAGNIKVEELFFLLGFFVISDGTILSVHTTVDLHVEYLDNTLRFNPIINGRKFIFTIHRVIAFHLFGNDLFEKGIEVIHKDNDMKNNSFDNIKLGTHSERMMATPAKQRQKLGSYAASKKQVYDPDIVIPFFDNCGGSWKKTMAEFGMSKSTLSGILNKRGQDTTHREIKLDMLKGYIETVSKHGDKANPILSFFIKLHNMLIIETMFKDVIAMNELQLAKHLNIKKSVKIEEVCKIFFELRKENVVVNNIAKVEMIDDVKNYLESNPDVYTKVMEYDPN